MHTTRRTLLRWAYASAVASLVGASALLLSACANTAADTAPQARAALAPAGVLRVGVYPGSPTSLVKTSDGQAAGVAHDLGEQLARKLNVPVQWVEFKRVAEVLDAMKSGAVDFTFTHATADRAQSVDFTAPLLSVELGYLVPGSSTLRTAEDIDRAGLRIGVAQGSTSQGVLGKKFKQAQVVGVASLKDAAIALREGRIDAFATNKAILFELADQVAGSRVLDGRWGLEEMAIAVPTGRRDGAAYLAEFARQASQDGSLQAMVRRAGLRGAVAADAR